MINDEHDPNIDTRLQWLKDKQIDGTQPSIIEVDGMECKYTLVVPGVEARLPYVVGGDVLKGNLFISQDVPEHYREFILSHEIWHATKYAETPEKEACVLAIQDEIDSVMLKLTTEEAVKYIKGTAEEDGFEGRIGFFNALVTYYEDPEVAKHRSTEFIEGIKNARDYLETFK